MRKLVYLSIFLSVFVAASFAQKQSAAPQANSKPRPHVIVVGVNGMELDMIRPLILKGAMPNLARVVNNGAYGKLRTVSAPNCPRVYSTIFTSTKPDEHGVTGFLVGGITANTNMLKQEPIWSVLSRNDVTVGMANVPATFPVLPVNGYMISGMLTRGKGPVPVVLVQELARLGPGAESQHVVPPGRRCEEIGADLGAVSLRRDHERSVLGLGRALGPRGPIIGPALERPLLDKRALPA